MVKRPTKALAAALSVGFAAQAGAAEKIEFAARCKGGESITIAAVGDLLFHTPLQAQALGNGGSFHRFWRSVAPVFTAADITYGNLEGPVAEGLLPGGRETKDPGRNLDYKVYGARQVSLNFNYHPSLIGDLSASGFDVVSTANNHALDRGALGIDRTITNLETEGLAFTGTRKRGETSRPWSTVVRKKGFSVAWLACTWGTNGFPDAQNQVLNCYKHKDQVLSEIKKLAADPNIDAVMVTPHWGEEGAQRPLRKDRELARELIEAGATAVIGTHPHVLQPWEKLVTASGREGLVVYSTGNFISNQRSVEQRSGEIVVLELGRNGKDTPGAKAELRAAAFVPTWVDIPDGYRIVENTGQGKLQKSALQTTLALMPAANKIRMTDVRQLTRDCPAPGTPIADVGPAPTYVIDPVPAPSTQAVAAQPAIAAATMPAALSAPQPSIPQTIVTATASEPATTHVWLDDKADRQIEPPAPAAAPQKVASAEPTILSRMFGWLFGSNPSSPSAPAGAKTPAAVAPSIASATEPKTPAPAEPAVVAKEVEAPVVVAAAAALAAAKTGGDEKPAVSAPLPSPRATPAIEKPTVAAAPAPNARPAADRARPQRAPTPTPKLVHVEKPAPVKAARVAVYRPSPEPVREEVRQRLFKGPAHVHRSVARAPGSAKNWTLFGALKVE